jgi:hypothetical protein
LADRQRATARRLGGSATGNGSKACRIGNGQRLGSATARIGNGSDRQRLGSATGNGSDRIGSDSHATIKILSNLKLLTLIINLNY